MTHYPHLSSPIRLGNVTLRNRMFAAPMGGTDITADCSVGPRTPGFYELRAKGGAAAVTAARRGHDVTLCEKTGELGGILKEEQAIPFKYEMYQLGVTLARIAEREGVKIRLNTTVTPELVAEEAPDALLLAVGSNPIVPRLPGIDGDNVIIVNDYYLKKDQVQDTVVVLGGGLAGCECAVHLGMEGKTVHLVEMREQVASDCNIRQRPILMKELEKYVTCHTSCTGLAVTPE